MKRSLAGSDPTDPTDATVAAAAALLGPYERRGGNAYLGEPVTQIEHARQSAALAEAAGAASELIVAALLHDLGWIAVASNPAAGRGHDEIGAGLISAYLPETVAAPVRLHVKAKRYLCTKSPTYADRLSDASKLTLVQQGGLMDAAALQAFETEGGAEDALALRQWDDLAKVVDKAAPPLEYYRGLVESLTLSG